MSSEAEAQDSFICPIWLSPVSSTRVGTQDTLGNEPVAKCRNELVKEARSHLCMRAIPTQAYQGSMSCVENTPVGPVEMHLWARDLDAGGKEGANLLIKENFTRVETVRVQWKRRVFHYFTPFQCLELRLISPLPFSSLPSLSSPLFLLNSNNPEIQTEGRQRAREPRDTIETEVL